jgi:transcriptional regulator GlxA family with amidase domain
MLAERLGVSRPTLDRAFNADIGLPPAKFLARLRLEEAKRLLRDTDMTASQISSALGYCNGAYFSNAFRRAMGASPKEWRRCVAAENATA